MQVFERNGVSATSASIKARVPPKPGLLCVVSSDRRIQVAARRRRAIALDSDKFLAAAQRDAERDRSPEKPAAGPVSEGELDLWMNEIRDAFGKKP